MGHYLRDCEKSPHSVKTSINDNLSYSIVVKAKSNMLDRFAVQLGMRTKKSMDQQFYVEDDEAKITEKEDPKKIALKSGVSITVEHGKKNCIWNGILPLCRV